LSFRRRLVTGRGSNQQIIVKRVSQALQRAADSWLAQEQACSARVALRSSARTVKTIKRFRSA
jgi:hypothetical protein